jgi:hypothetical protein
MRAGGVLLRFGPAGAVIAVILLTNFPAMLGLVHPNPIDVTGMASQLTPGPLPGVWSIDPNIGTAQAQGHLVALDWLHGQVPWWNPFEGIGSPLAAGIQSAAFFPPVLLFALANGSLYFHVFLELTCGLATYLLIGELGMTRAVAAAGGIVFGLNGTLAWLSNEPMNPVAFLPMLVLGIEMCFRRRGSDAGWIVVALALALSVYAGFPETTCLDLILAAVWAAVRLVQARRTGGGAGARVAARLAGGAAVGVLLALPIIVPFGEYLSGAYIGHHAGDALGGLSLKLIHLPLLGLPYFYGPILAFPSGYGMLSFWGLAGGYVTASTVLLAIAGLFGSRRERGLRIALGVFLVVVLLWQFGVPPFVQLAESMPLLSEVWSTRYLAPMWELAFVVAACFALEMLGRDRRARGAALAAGIAALGGMVVILTRQPGAAAARVAGAHIYELITLLGALVVVLAITAAAALPRRAWTGWLVTGVLVLDAAVAAGLPQFSSPVTATVDTAPVAYLRTHLGDGRFFSFGLYSGDYGSYFGISQLDETDLPVPGAWAREIVDHLGSNMYPVNFDGRAVATASGPSPAAQVLANLSSYERLDVRYLVVATSDPVLGRGPHYPAGIRRVFEDSVVTILALPHPRAYLSVSSGGPCSLSSASSDLFTAVCRSPATVVRSELDLAGWAATLNGRSVPVLDQGGLLTAVRVPAGRSIVSFSYAPPHIDLAVGGFALGGCALVTVPALRRRRRRRRARGGHPSLGTSSEERGGRPVSLG